MNRVSTFREYIKNIIIESSGSLYGADVGAPLGFVIPPPNGDINLEQASGTITLNSTGGVESVTIVNEGNGYVEPVVPYLVGKPTTFAVISGTTDITPDTYTNIQTTTDSDDGSGCTVQVVVNSDGTVIVTTLSGGNNKYRETDNITIDPIALGGQSTQSPIVAQVVRINLGSGAVFSTDIDKISTGDVYSQPVISPVVKNQIPESLQVEFPLFKTLFEKYYQFMEQTNTVDNTKHGPLKVLQDFLSKLDVDFNDDGSPNTDDNFLVEFFKDYAKDLPLNQSAKLSRVLKDINSFYTAKGSSEAIKYLFRILYNEEVSVRNSSEFLLRPSSNEYQQDYVVKVYDSQFLTGNPNDLEGRRVKLWYAKSEGAATTYYHQEATVEKAKKISYTNPPVWQLTLDLPTSFELVGPGVGNRGYDFQLQGYVSGTINSITGLGSGGSFVDFDGQVINVSVVDGTYTLASSNLTSYLDVPWESNTTYEVGTYVKANSLIYLVVEEGTSLSTGTGPSHEGGDKLNGTVKFRYISAEDHFTTNSNSDAEFEIVISGNNISTITRLGDIASVSVGAADASRTAGTYYITSYTTSNDGSGAQFTVTVDTDGAATVVIPTGNEGTRFRVGETITISDSLLGSGGAADLVLTVDSITCGTGYQPDEIIEFSTQHVGHPDGSSAPKFYFKVDTIENGTIDSVVILDGGTGFSANPDIQVIAHASDTITQQASITTRLTDGAISDTVFVSNLTGRGYNNTPTLRVSVNNVLTYITHADESGLASARAFPIRLLKKAKFDSIRNGDYSETYANNTAYGLGDKVLVGQNIYEIIIAGTSASSGGGPVHTVGAEFDGTAKFRYESSIASTTSGGFRVGDVFKVSETGDILGAYAIDYFAEDYALDGIDNNGYIRISRVGSDGYPTAFEVLAVGTGYFREEFLYPITSATGQSCWVKLTTGYNALLAGVFKDAGSFLSNANKLFDNRVYQNFSYEIESERQQPEWNEYVKRAAHPIGFGVFGNLQIRQSVDFSGNFQVETDAYMFFKYPDIEEILVDETVAKFLHKTATPDSVVMGDGLTNRENIGAVINKLDVEKNTDDTFVVSSEVGPYTIQGSEVENIYATSDGSITGEPYFFQYPDPEDDYVERLQTGDYFLEDYVYLGNPYKDITMMFDSTNTGGYATDYFAEDYVRFVNADPQRGSELPLVDDDNTSLSVQIIVQGGDDPTDVLYASSDGTLSGAPYFFQHTDPDDDYVISRTAGGDGVLFDDAIVLSFVYFRTPTDSVEFDDTSILFERGRLVDDSVAMEDDAVELFKGKLQESRVVAIQDLTVDLFSKVLGDTFDAGDSTAFDVTTTADDTMNMQDSPSVEVQSVTSDTFTVADAVDKLDVGVIPSDTFGVNDSVGSFDITVSYEDTFDVQDAVEKLDVGAGPADTFEMEDVGSLTTQSYMVDLTYFAEDYVADTVVSF